ncbi:DPP IV N-terminal domain-containing protein [Micromonospora sp. M12]
MHLLDLDDGWVDVHWDRETYPYLTGVSWSEGSPLITVLRRSQQHGLVLAVDPRTGETQVHAELADPRWVEPIAGTRRTCRTAGCWSAGSWPTTGTTHGASSPTAPCSPAVAVRTAGGGSTAGRHRSGRPAGGGE